jgi:hypothetical protein
MGDLDVHFGRWLRDGVHLLGTNLNARYDGAGRRHGGPVSK